MTINKASKLIAATLVCLAGAGRAHAAALNVVTPGEQNTQSGENGCKAAPCAAGHWLHYPELLQVALGANYVVHNNGDGGAVLGCDATTATAAGGGSFCKSGTYTASLTPVPDIVIIGPFGEHDQRIVGASTANVTALYKQSVFEAAYEGLVQKYLKGTTKVYMMTPIDVPWGGTPNLPAGDDLVKNVMLPAALKVAADHQLPVIDTYTAISGTPALVTQYYANDGQVNAAGQMKMSMLILAALQSGGGSDGGASDAPAADAGGKDASGAGGTGGTTSGAGGTTSVAGTSGTTAGTAGTTATTTGAAGTTSTGAAGTSAAGTAGTTTGGAGTGTTTGAAGTTVSSGSSGGCAVASPASGGALGLTALGLLGVVGLARRRSRRR